MYISDIISRSSINLIEKLYKNIDCNYIDVWPFKVQRKIYRSSSNSHSGIIFLYMFLLTAAV